MKLLDRLLSPFRPRSAETTLAAAATHELLANSGGGATNPLYRQVAVPFFIDFMAGVPDPDEVLRRTGRTRADLRQLLRDAEVSQALETRRDAVIATPWRLEPGNGRAAKFVYDELASHMPRIIFGMWESVPYGYSVIEPIYGRRGGRIGLDRVSVPPFEWFRPMQDGTLRYFPSDGTGGINGIACDPRKFMLATRNATLMNPYGESLLSVLYWPVTWRLQGWQLWLNFLETFGSPIVVGRTGSYNAFIEAMAAQGVARAIGWQPTGDNEEITAITASTPGEFERLNDCLSKTIAKVVLGQTLTSDVGKVGSYAAAKVHDDVRDDKRRADLRVVSAGAQHLVDALWQINGFQGAAPQFVMQDDVGLERERADRDAILAEKLGVRFTKPYFTDRYDLNEVDFEVGEPTPQSTPGTQGGGPEQQEEAVNQSATSTPKFTPKQEVIERQLGEVIDIASIPLSLKDLRSVIAGATDEADLAARLATLIDKQDPRYATLLARAQFAANVLGYVHAVETPATP